MADKEEDSGGGNPAADLLWLLFFLFILFVAWFAVGGPSRAELGSLFLQSPTGIYEAGTSTPQKGSSDWFPVSYDAGTSPVFPGSAAFEDTLKEFKGAPSLQQGKVSFTALYGAQATDPAKEYIEIQADYSNTQPIHISGWRIQSLKTGRMAIIGTAVETPMTGQGGTPGAVVLTPGERAEISSGRSPIGVSFRVNKCSGYLAQFQEFTPALVPICPNAVGELTASGGTLANENACVAAAAKIAPCKALTAAPSGVSGACGSFLTRTLSYGSCVQMHQKDTDFRQNEWRLYEGNTTELWVGNGDTLVLLDQSGRLVSSASY